MEASVGELLFVGFLVVTLGTLGYMLAITI